MIPDQPVLRLCVRLGPAEDGGLPADQCTIPGRCERRQCSRCGHAVHYDPQASIPLLGPEVILCILCLDAALEAAPDGNLGAI